MSAHTRLGGMVLVLLVAASPARSQFVDPQAWGTDGNVAAVLREANTVYIAGSFSVVSPNTGGGVEVDPIVGDALRAPKVGGVVEAVIPDGAGGWYIGGQFVSVGGRPRRNLAHVMADGRLSDWAPEPDASVDALALCGGTLYAGGRFTTIGGVSRRSLASLEEATGRVLQWDPSPDGRVRTFAVRAGHLYVGGDFSTIASQSRWSLAEFDCASGQLTDWDLRVGSLTGPGSIRALTLWDDTLYVGGMIAASQGVSRSSACAFDLVAHQLVDWNPRVTAPGVSLSFGNEFVSALGVFSGGVVLGGHFTGVGGAVRPGLGLVDRVTGIAEAWCPIFDATLSEGSADISSILIDGDSAYVAGTFFGVNGADRDYCAKLDLGSSAVCRWNPQPTDRVSVIASQLGRVFLGGPFAGLGTQGVSRSGLAAFDATTGAVKEWNPNPVGYGVQALAMARGHLYVGGYFWEIGGQPCDGLAAVDTLSGAATGWHPQVDNWPLTLEPVGDTLFVGGAFKVVDGQSRGRLAAFNLNTGALADWAPFATSDVFDIETRDSMVVIAGGFNYVNGVPRLHGLAAVNRYSGALLDWDPQPSGWASAIRIVGDTVIVGGAFSTIGGQSRSNLAALDLRTGQALDWRADANGQVNALAMIGDTLFAGGLFYTVAGQPRNSLAAVDLHTGALLDWDLGLSSVEYGFSNPVVWGLAAADHTLYVGGAFGRAGLVPAGGLAAYSFRPPPPEPPPLPVAVALAPISPNPVRGPMNVRFDLPRPADVSLSIFDLQGRRVSRPLDHAPELAGSHSIQLDASGWPRGFYFCLFEAEGIRTARKFVVLR